MFASLLLEKTKSFNAVVPLFGQLIFEILFVAKAYQPIPDISEFKQSGSVNVFEI